VDTQDRSFGFCFALHEYAVLERGHDLSVKWWQDATQNSDLCIQAAL
jgi:hypothetical protein